MATTMSTAPSSFSPSPPRYKATSSSSISRMSCWPHSLKETPPSPSPPPSAMMTNSLHDELSTSSPRLNKDEEMLELISDPKSAITYRRGRLIGKGGFAKVYEVTELVTSKCYADKVINREVFARRSTSKDKVKREIMLHKDLIHPNVVGFCHFFTDDRSNVHIILEYCAMKSLLHVMKNRKVLTEPEVRYYMVQICEGVRYIHQRGILHRDLKLGNMFLTWDMLLKIGDFGLATTMPTGSENGTGGEANTLCGTPNYIAPEVLRKQGHGVEADIWAIGCMMYAMLVGTPPFETKSLGRTYQKIAANEYEIPDRLSPSARAFIRMLLHPEPQQRGHLHQPGHPEDLSCHPFFTTGFCPKTLPSSASTQPPRLPLETLYDSNLSGKFPDLQFGSGDVNPNSSVRIRSALKQKFSQMFNSQHYNYRKRDRLIFQIIEIVETWLISRPSNNVNESGPLSFVPIFVSKWIDYSNKYGFGYQLSDKSVGVLFNDSTRISRTADGRYNEFADAKGKLVTFAADNPSPSISGNSSDFGGRVRLLDYFARYMDENLADGVTASLCQNQMTLSTVHKTMVPHVLHWLRTQSTVIMALNNNSLQINFIRDHAKMIFWGEPNSAFVFVTYMSSDRVPLTYNLRSLPRARISAAIEQKISQEALPALRELGQNLITQNAVEQ